MLRIVLFLLFSFMVATTVYLIGGFIFKHFYLHAQGVEIIPHYSFWSDFPLLVRVSDSFSLFIKFTKLLAC